MQLHRLRLENFRQHAQTEIVFGPGITAIIGPNGVGKTTLLEAIAWAFYGASAARGSRDTIRWHHAPARASVRVDVEFTLGAHEFRVVRGLYTAELFQDGAEQPIVISHQEVSARIERFLGMTREEFFNTYFTGQKELAVMAAMGPTDRARFLSHVLGYDKLRVAQDRLREVRSGLRGELAGLERGLVDADELSRERETAVARLAAVSRAVEEGRTRQGAARLALEREGPAWTRAVEIRESALSLDGERRVAERDVDEARRAFERLDRELAEALAAKDRLATLAPELDQVAPLKADLERLEREAQGAGRRRALEGQQREVADQVAHVRERLAGAQDAPPRLDAAQRALAPARETLTVAEAAEETARTAWVRDRQDAETKRQTFRDQYADVQKHRHAVVEAGSEGACPVCKRALGAVYQEVLDTLERQLEEIEVKGKFFRQRYEQLGTEPAEVREAQRRAVAAARRVEEAVQDVARWEARERERAELDTEVARLEEHRRALEREVAALPDTYDAERHDTVRQRLRALEPTIQQAAEVRGKAERAERLVTEAEAAEKALSQCEQRVKDLQAALADLGYSEERYHEARSRYEAAAAAVREADLELASVQGDLRACEATLEAVARRIKEREERAARLVGVRRELDLHDELDQTLHDLRLELNAAMRPDLSERASEFLADLTDGRYHELELDEQYRVLVIEDGVPKPVMSGGEEDLTNLVLRLAISQMVAERAGQPLSLLVLDEIFGSLDEHRRRNVVELLRRLGDRFPQVVLITHVESVRDGVDRVLRVAFDEERGAAVVTDDEEVPVGEDVAA